ncbi:hypothetical protein DKM19_47115 [Streptosporangium sp. 'caverna']|nr:hypothetical protein DKM19_47115 [Streptosporangium sp. 'caverna']
MWCDGKKSSSSPCAATPRASRTETRRTGAGSRPGRTATPPERATPAARPATGRVPPCGPRATA